jgi:hypothetical protein
MPDPTMMIVFAIVILLAIGVFTFIILRRGKIRRRPTVDSDPATATEEWLKREAKNRGSRRPL